MKGCQVSKWFVRNLGIKVSRIFQGTAISGYDVKVAISHIQILYEIKDALIWPLMKSQMRSRGYVTLTQALRRQIIREHVPRSPPDHPTSTSTWR